MQTCIFCKIIAREIPANILYETDDVIAFSDIHPDAPVHVLIMPKKHHATTIEMSEQSPQIFGEMLKASTQIARDKGIDKSGFRLILNTNADGGQEIFHVHMPLLGGEPIGHLRCKHR